MHKKTQKHAKTGDKTLSCQQKATIRKLLKTVSSIVHGMYKCVEQSRS